MEPQPLLLFPPFRLDPVNERLWRGKRVCPLKPKTFAVLRYLVEHSGQLVTKNELLDTLWADVHVGDAVLKVCLREIRAALGDNAKAPHFIETVHRRGYRFLPAVTTAQPDPRSTFKVSSSKPSFHSASSLDREEGASFQLGTWNLKPGTSLVGREAESAQLHAWLEKALSSERQIVFVTGEPGIGKTTLVEAFLHGLESRVQSLESENHNSSFPLPQTLDSRRQTLDARPWIGRGQCLEQYGAGEAYLPVLEAFNQLCREPGNSSIIETFSRYAPTWLIQMPALLSEPEVKALRRRAGSATQERMLREMAEAVEALTVGRGLILRFDDLQWSDYATLDLISYLARRSRPACLLLIGAYRPVDVILKEHPLKLVKQDLRLHGRCEELSLELLTEEGVAAYLDARFTGGAIDLSSLHQLAQIIHRRTEGNPLFMVSVVDYLLTQRVIVRRNGQWTVAGEVGNLPVPLNLRQFIEQQLERVAPESRDVLEAASVIGMEFSTAVVAAGLEAEEQEVERCCAELVHQGQFLREQGVSEWPDGTITARYGFLHSLHHEIVYDRLPISRRAKLHRRIGEYVETAYGARVKEVAGELALHFEQGWDYPRALQYHQQAGENAIRRSAHREAVTHLMKAVEALRFLPDTVERAQQELTLQLLLGTQLSTSKGFGSSEAARAYAQARALCDRVGETPQRFMALGGLFTFHLTRVELRTAHDLAEQLHLLAQHTQFDGFFVWAYLCLGMTLQAKGDTVLARELLRKSVAIYDPEKHRFPVVQDPGVLSLSQLAHTLWILGYPEQAVKRGQEALSLARQVAHPLSLSHALLAAGRTRQMCGERQATQNLAGELSVFCHEQGFSLHAAGGTILQGWVLAKPRGNEEGITQIRQGLGAYNDAGSALNKPYVLALLAEAYGKDGQTDEGLKVVNEALALVDSTEERWCEAELYRLKGELLRQQLERFSRR